MSDTDLASVRAVVSGRVQGVFFRAFTLQQATNLGLTGYVDNLPSGESVEVRAEGERKKLEELIAYLKIGPPRARVEEVVTEWSEYCGRYSTFRVR